jgi:hypothetical protein
MFYLEKLNHNAIKEITFLQIFNKFNLFLILYMIYQITIYKE